MLEVEILQSSFEKIKPYESEFSASFYENLFTMYPEAEPLFAKTDMEAQKEKLWKSLMSVILNLRYPDILTQSLKGLGARHVQYGALPEHYPLVGNALLITFEEYLESDWTEEIKQAWTNAYNDITELMLSGADYSPEDVALDSSETVEEITLDSSEIETIEQVDINEQVTEEEGLKVALLESSFEQIKPQADEFVNSFYENLFTMYPSAKPLFEHTNMAKQKTMLLNSLVLVVENLTKPDVLSEKLKGLGARHVKYGALPEHYPLVGNALLTTFEQYLKLDWTEEVKQAWVEAYGAITELMLSGADYSAQEVALDSVPPVEDIPADAVEVNSEADEEEGLKVALLESSFEQIKPQADEFVNSFYENLFTMYPSAKPLFEHTNMAKQKTMLLNSLVLVVENLTKPDVLSEKLKGLGARHVKYGALPEHYPLVGNALLTTFEQYLKLDWTEEVKQAWVEAYGAITELMLSGADYSAQEVALDSVPTVEDISSNSVEANSEVSEEIPLNSVATKNSVEANSEVSEEMPLNSVATKNLVEANSEVSEEVSLNSVATNLRDEQIDYSVYEQQADGGINWGAFGGVFAGGGILTILLLLLL